MQPFNKHTIGGLVFLLIGLGACGFHLRGTDLTALQTSQNISIYVESSDADMLVEQIEQQLLDAGIEPVSDILEADYIIIASNELFDTRVLSVSPTTGNVEEYEVIYTVLLKISNRDEKNIATNETISATRDYTFNDEVVIGKNREESVLKEDIIRQVATTVLRRLRAIVQ